MGMTFFTGYSDMISLSNLYNIFALLTCYLFLALLLDIYAVSSQASNKIGLLLCFIVGMYLILPFILSGLFEVEVISFYSPVGFIASFFNDYKTDIAVKNTFCLINALLCIFPALIIWTRYNYIIKQRQEM